MLAVTAFYHALVCVSAEGVSMYAEDVCRLRDGELVGVVDHWLCRCHGCGCFSLIV